MRRKKDLPQEFKCQIDNLIKDLHPSASIISCNVYVCDSIIKKLYNKYVQTFFGGVNVNKENIYTAGTMYSRFVKLFNYIYENSTDITGVKIELVKKYKSYLSPSYIKRFATPENEHKYYDYVISVKFDGQTEERRRSIEEYKKQKEAEEKAAQERRQRRIEHIAYYKELNKNEQYEFLGCANGWGNDVPELVKQADKDSDCFYECENLGRCYNKYICHKYKFYYTVDSSD